MKRFIVIFACLAVVTVLKAQGADSLQAIARSQMQQGNFEAACKTLAIALQNNPGNLDLLKDQVYANLLKRDFVTTLQLAKTLTERPDADVQCYQLLGNTYKELALYKEGGKMYKEAIKKFATSGVLYSEYGDLLAQNNESTAAIATWEKGIQADVNNNGNYYYAAKHYLTNGNNLQGLLYGEIFVNIESYTQRTEEMKGLLFKGYRKLLAGPALKKMAGSGEGFLNIVANLVNKNASAQLDSVTIENITELRWKFILDWVNSPYAKQYPYRLFDMHKQLVDYKIFDAYNQWLFGAATDADKYQAWQTAHADQMGQWLQMLHNIVFKIPAGQYYGN